MKIIICTENKAKIQAIEEVIVKVWSNIEMVSEKFSSDVSDQPASNESGSEVMKKIPAHQWTNENGEVLILRFSDKNGKSYNGFQHPMTVGESVVEPKWNEAFLRVLIHL